ncbi:MAG: hypothetical protein WD077_09450 [Bacteroidia bacterium]
MTKLMKLPFLALSFLLIASACTKDSCKLTDIRRVNIPVYMSLEEFRQGVKMEAPRLLENPGKIYFYQGYLFINEYDEGIHVYDNRNPGTPSNLGFIKIKGNYELAVKNGVLLADSYMDLVAIDISDPGNAREAGRLPDVFEHYATAQGFPMDEEQGVIVDWEEKELTEVTDNCDRYSYYNYNGSVFQGTTGSGTMPVAVAENASGAEQGGSSSGIGGSMARFTISGDYLYSISTSSMEAFDVSAPTSPVRRGSQTLSRMAETIFPYEDKLFLGTTTGMMIYSLANPALPQFISELEHVTSCDPVAVEGQFAYVTLRDGNTCQNFTNQLEVVDISNIQAPKLLAVHPMHNPHGLGIDDGTLFICDGDAGLKVFDATDPLTIGENLISSDASITAIDVIPFNDILMVISKEGFYQYDYSDPVNLRLLSVIPVTGI